MWAAANRCHCNKSQRAVFQSMPCLCSAAPLSIPPNKSFQSADRRRFSSVRSWHNWFGGRSVGHVTDIAQNQHRTTTSHMCPVACRHKIHFVHCAPNNPGPAIRRPTLQCPRDAGNGFDRDSWRISGDRTLILLIPASRRLAWQPTCS